MVAIQYLKHDPLQIFYNSKTPIGLYARKKWLNQEGTSNWETDFRETVDALFSGQSKNGSWNNTLLPTIHKLFGLHLTVRTINERIINSLEWLMSVQVFIAEEKNTREKSAQIFSKDLQNLPFSRGCFEHFVKGSILFLATIFGKGDDARVIRAYEVLRTRGEQRGGTWCTWSCSNNILRAFVVHPRYAKSKALNLFVARLAEIQRSDGGWPRQIPFYQTVNALGHLDFRLSDSLLRQAFQRLRETQNSDGTWGTSQKEWNTFLVVHALKRKSSVLS
jgi:hypothetical protein